MVLEELASPGLGPFGHLRTDSLPRHPDFLISQEPVTHDYVDRVFEALLAGMGPRP